MLRIDGLTRSDILLDFGIIMRHVFDLIDKTNLKDYEEFIPLHIHTDIPRSPIKLKR